MNMRRTLSALLTFLAVVTAAPDAGAGADRYAVQHHAGLFVVLQRNDELRQVAAEGCLLGAHQSFAERWRDVFESGPVPAASFCLTAFSAALQRGELDALLARYRAPTADAGAAGLALATGFLDGFLTPERYARYLSAPNAMVQQLTGACLALAASRKDCLIAGAIQGLVERRFVEANPDLRSSQFAHILK